MKIVRIKRNGSRTEMTSNEYYGAMNRRFDRRAALLRRFGWKYTCVSMPRYEGERKPETIGVFRHLHRRGAIPAAQVLTCYNDSFIAILETILNRAA